MTKMAKAVKNFHLVRGCFLSSSTFVTNIDIPVSPRSSYDTECSKISKVWKTSILHWKWCIQRNPFHLFDSTAPSVLCLEYDCSNFSDVLFINFCLLSTYRPVFINRKNLLRFAHYYEPLSVLCWSWNRGVWKDDFVNFDFDFSDSLFITFGETDSGNISRYSFARRLPTFHHVHGIG